MSGQYLTQPHCSHCGHHLCKGDSPEEEAAEEREGEERGGKERGREERGGEEKGESASNYRRWRCTVGGDTSP